MAVEDVAIPVIKAPDQLKGIQLVATSLYDITTSAVAFYTFIAAN